MWLNPDENGLKLPMTYKYQHANVAIVTNNIANKKVPKTGQNGGFTFGSDFEHV